ncbi:MAG: 30S ribosomal protein S20 [Dehalococcoidia bacterium]|nr:30S ribosomal protein S20 [Dehalococcoidia bacterium]
MAHSLSAKKRHRQAVGRFERNRPQRSAARTAVRNARETIAAGATEEAQAAVQKAASVLDRAARKGVLHRNTAARSKSRLMRQLSNLGAEGAKPRARRSQSRKTPAKKS